MPKKLIKKKPAKRKAAKKRKPKKPLVQAIVPFSDILVPETYKGKYTITTSTFTIRQIEQILAKTPKDIIQSRPGKGGGNWSYVPGWWFKKRLNFIFGFDGWNFEITGERVDGDFITVKGTLEIVHQKTSKVLTRKTDYGGKEIAFHKNKAHKPEHYLDISNDFKAAATDCLKRCAVQIGLAMDIYGSNELMQEGYTPPKKEDVIDVPADEMKDYSECNDCGAMVNPAVTNYSKKMYRGKVYCQTCQKERKK